MISALMLAWSMATSPAHPGHVRARDWEDGSRQVGVWVMTFFDKVDKFHHWADVKRRHAPMPIGGPFSSSDPDEVAKEYAAIRAAGIDYVLLDDTNTIYVDEGLIDKTVKAWFDYGDKQPAGQRLQIAVAAGGELNQHSDPKMWQAAVDGLFKRYSGRPSYLRANGRPVLYWYIEKDIEPNWTDPRWTIRKTFHFFRTSDQMTHGGWGYGSEDTPRPPNLECASIHPGWDLDLPGYPRVGGDHYCDQWCRAIESRAKSVLLSDWNGWNEGTGLGESMHWLDHYGEPTPTWYEDLTRGYVNLFKLKFVEGAYYRPEGKPPVYQYTKGAFVHQGEYPDGKPVIVVPAGAIRGFPPGD